MANKSASYAAMTSKQVSAAQKPDAPSTIFPSGQEEPRFADVLAQLKHKNMPSLASSIRQGNETPEHASSSSTTVPSLVKCKVLPKPPCGSYHLAYRILFEDGLEWILKVPIHGHHACFDRLAAEALTSEALTMKMIKCRTSISVPTVHHFDAPADNMIGCPYILMDFLKGKPLWQGWFDEDVSSSMLEQFRATALQTIAAAMIQLNQFTTDRGGSLQFDSNGWPVDVIGAKAPDWLAEQDIMQGLKTEVEGCLYCEKGPISDPASSFLFILNRRGVRETDGACERGILEIMRLFTEWTLEKARSTHEKGHHFVLAHPDFAVQNLLVENDGTLCGVIDWDGVAAVPVSVGCLRYPDWLMSDWQPEYDYRPGCIGQQINSPEELTTYRSMYAQFIEVFASIKSGSSKAGKSTADITRMSLVAGSLNIGAHDLKLTGRTIDIVFRKSAAFTSSPDDSEISKADSGSRVGINADDSEQFSNGDVGNRDSSSGDDNNGDDSNGDNSNGDTTITEVDNSILDEEESSVECLGPKYIAELSPEKPSAKNIDATTDKTNFSTAHASYGGSRQEHDETCASSGINTGPGEVAADRKASTSRKARFAKWALGLGEEGCKRMTKAIHKKEASESKPSKKFRVPRCALGLGERGCKGASEIFHKKEKATRLRSPGQTEMLSSSADSQSVPRLRKLVISLCESTETLLRKVIAQMHRDCTIGTDLLNPKKIKTKLIQKPTEDDPNTSTVVEQRSPDDVALSNAKHCQECSTDNENPSQTAISDRTRSLDITPDDVWTSIAAEIEKGGIPLDLIKKRQDVIAQCIITYLGQDIQQERGKEFQLKISKFTKETKKAHCEAEMASTMDTSHQDSNLHPAGHSLSNQAWPMADGEHVKPETIHKSPTYLLAGMENETKEEPDKAVSTKLYPENAAGLKLVVISPKQFDTLRISPRHAKSHDDAYEPSENESSVFKLEAANRRFDLEKASKGEDNGSASLGSANPIAAFAQLGKSKLQKSVQGALTLNAIEETNRKLRMILSNLAKPKAASTYCDSKEFQSTEGHGPATEYLGHEIPDKWKENKTLLGTVSANPKLKTMLSSIQGLAAVDLELHQTKSTGVRGRDNDEKSEITSRTSSPTFKSGANRTDSDTAIKRGRWFETARGSLKRIQYEESSNTGLHDQGLISQLNEHSAATNAQSSRKSVSGHDDDKLKRVSNLPRVSANRNGTKVLNHFQVPDTDAYDEGYDQQESAEKTDGREHSELDEGEIDEVAAGSVDGQFDEGVVLLNEELDDAEVKDLGCFTAGEVCVALGDGNLDEQRMLRLREGFIALLDDMVGRRRR